MRLTRGLLAALLVSINPSSHAGSGMQVSRGAGCLVVCGAGDGWRRWLAQQLGAALPGASAAAFELGLLSVCVLMMCMGVRAMRVLMLMVAAVGVAAVVAVEVVAVVAVGVGVGVRPHPVLVGVGVGVCMVLWLLLDADHIVQDCPLVEVGQGCRGGAQEGCGSAGGARGGGRRVVGRPGLQGRR